MHGTFIVASESMKHAARRPRPPLPRPGSTSASRSSARSMPRDASPSSTIPSRSGGQQRVVQLAAQQELGRQVRDRLRLDLVLPAQASPASGPSGSAARCGPWRGTCRSPTPWGRSVPCPKFSSRRNSRTKPSTVCSRVAMGIVVSVTLATLAAQRELVTAVRSLVTIEQVTPPFPGDTRGPRQSLG